MEKILLAYNLPIGNIKVIMMHYRNPKVKGRSPNDNTDFFDIVHGILLRDPLAPYLFIICQDNVLRTLIDLIKENGFTLKIARSRRYPAETITGAGYANDKYKLNLNCISIEQKQDALASS